MLCASVAISFSRRCTLGASADTRHPTAAPAPRRRLDVPGGILDRITLPGRLLDELHRCGQRQQRQRLDTLRRELEPKLRRTLCASVAISFPRRRTRTLPSCGTISDRRFAYPPNHDPASKHRAGMRGECVKGQFYTRARSEQFQTGKKINVGSALE